MCFYLRYGWQRVQCLTALKRTSANVNNVQISRRQMLQKLTKEKLPRGIHMNSLMTTDATDVAWNSLIEKHFAKLLNQMPTVLCAAWTWSTLAQLCCHLLGVVLSRTCCLLFALQKVEKTAAVGRLTDTSRYTGSHKERFDDSGKGRGREGREELVENTGYVGAYKNAGTYDDKMKVNKWVPLHLFQLCVSPIAVKSYKRLQLFCFHCGTNMLMC